MSLAISELSAAVELLVTDLIPIAREPFTDSTYNLKVSYQVLLDALQADLDFGSGSGHTIEDEGTPLTQRASLNFVGAGVAVTDAGGKTVVTIGGGTGISIGDALSSGTANRVLYEDATNKLAESAAFTFTAASGRLALSTTGSGAGILIGGDVLLYRSAADTLRTPDSLTVDGNILGNAIGGETVAVGTNTGFGISDTDDSHFLIIAPGSDLSANRTFSIITGDANRALTISADVTLNQSVDTTATPSFVSIIVANANGLQIKDTDASHNLKITTGSDLTATRTLTINPGDASRTLTLTGNATLNQAVDTTATPTFVSAIFGNASGIQIVDSDASHNLKITTGSNLSAARTLTINPGDASRTLTLTGNVTLSQTPTRVAGCTIDGGSATPTVNTKVYVKVPFSGNITRWDIFADAAGSAVVDVWKHASGTLPTVTDTIAASAKPTLSSAQINSDATLTGWTVAVAAGDIFGFNLDSVTTCKRITVELTIQEA